MVRGEEITPPGLNPQLTSSERPIHLRYLIEMPPSDTDTSFAIGLKPGNLKKRAGIYSICDLDRDVKCAYMVKALRFMNFKCDSLRSSVTFTDPSNMVYSHVMHSFLFVILKYKSVNCHT